MNFTNFTIPGIGLAAVGFGLSGQVDNSSKLPSVLAANITNDSSFSSALSSTQSSSLGTNSSTTKTEKQIREAARGFERTLIRQMLNTVRSNALRGGEEESQTSKGYLEIADDKLADALVAGKGIGFGVKVANQMLAQPNVKALIDAEKKTVNNNNISNLNTNISSVINQYKKVSTF